MLLNNIFIDPVNVVILLLGTFLFGASLLVSRNQRLANMRLFMLVCVALLFSSFLQSQTLFFTTSEQLQSALKLSIGPAFYLFVCGMVYYRKQRFIFVISHFLPALFVLMLEGKTTALTYLAIVSLIGYLILSLRLIRKYHMASFLTVSFAEGTRLTWVYQFVLTILIVSTMEWVRLGIQDNLTISLVQHWRLIDLILLSIAFGFLVQKAIRNPSLFDGMEDFEAQEEAVSIEVDDAYRDKAKQLFKSVESKINNDRWYALSGLSVQDLSREIGASFRDTSWAIAQGTGTTFCDFVNEMRVDAIKNAIAPDMPTEQINALSEDVGFTNRDSFQRVFKKFTGYGPKQYAKLNSATHANLR